MRKPPSLVKLFVMMMMMMMLTMVMMTMVMVVGVVKAAQRTRGKLQPATVGRTAGQSFGCCAAS